MLLGILLMAAGSGSCCCCCCCGCCCIRRCFCFCICFCFSGDTPLRASAAAAISSGVVPASLPSGTDASLPMATAGPTPTPALLPLARPADFSHREASGSESLRPERRPGVGGIWGDLGRALRCLRRPGGWDARLWELGTPPQLVAMPQRRGCVGRPALPCPALPSASLFEPTHTIRERDLLSYPTFRYLCTLRARMHTSS